MADRPRRFVTTRWSVVQAAGDSQSPESHAALEALCGSYWGPIYAYARHRGHSVDQAQDLAQGFFTKLLEKNYVKVADPERGRFRTFLLSCFKHYMANEWDRRRAQKRGGAQKVLSLDFETEEARYRVEPADTRTPEQVYQRRWAMAVLARAMTRLADEQRSAGRGPVFERLQPFLTSPPENVTYKDVAAGLGMSEGAVKVAVHRLRKRFGVALRQEIAETVADGAQAEAEIRSLFDVLGA